MLRGRCLDEVSDSARAWRMSVMSSSGRVSMEGVNDARLGSTLVPQIEQEKGKRIGRRVNLVSSSQSAHFMSSICRFILNMYTFKLLLIIFLFNHYIYLILRPKQLQFIFLVETDQTTKPKNKTTSSWLYFIHHLSPNQLRRK